MAAADGVRRFIFENADVRGEVVQLDQVVRGAMRHHEYPPAVASLVAAALSAGALLTATVKMEGRLTLQIQGDGPVSLVLVQASTDGALRAMARYAGEIAEEGFAALCGEGHLAITLEPEGHERYQGVVSLDPAGLGPTLERYFTDSEQLPTRIFLAGEPERSGGLLLQQLPSVTGTDPDAWNRIEHLGATTREDELLDLDAEALLHRLFHEERVRVFDPAPFTFQCRCSPERIGAILRSLGRDEIESIIEESGQVEIRCDFCGAWYRYDAVDAAEVLSQEEDAPRTPGSSTYH